MPIDGIFRRQRPMPVMTSAGLPLPDTMWIDEVRDIKEDDLRMMRELSSQTPGLVGDIIGPSGITGLLDARLGSRDDSASTVSNVPKAQSISIEDAKNRTLEAFARSRQAMPSPTPEPTVSIRQNPRTASLEWRVDVPAYSVGGEISTFNRF